ncbi:MAG: hypothetical protein IT429_18880 [Gemmataceae bacterium]|nr:hypothetical protein [Gemmataceae bacterium]
MRRTLKQSLLALAAWCLLAGAVQAQVYVCPPTVAYYSPAPVVTYAAPAPVVTYSAPAPVVTYAAPAPVVTYAAPAPVVTYSAPAYVAPVRYSFYSPVVAAVPTYASTSYYVRPGLFRPRVYSATTFYGPAPSYSAVYGSAYYTPLYFRY